MSPTREYRATPGRSRLQEGQVVALATLYTLSPVGTRECDGCGDEIRIGVRFARFPENSRTDFCPRCVAAITADLNGCRYELRDDLVPARRRAPGCDPGARCHMIIGRAEGVAEMRAALAAVEEIVRQDEAQIFGEPASIEPVRRSRMINNTSPLASRAGCNSETEAPGPMHDHRTPPRSPLLARLLDKPRAAAYLACSTVTLDRRVREGKISTYRADGRVLFDPSDLDAYIASSRVAARTP